MVERARVGGDKPGEFVKGFVWKWARHTCKNGSRMLHGGRTSPATVGWVQDLVGKCRCEEMSFVGEVGGIKNCAQSREIPNPMQGTKKEKWEGTVYLRAPLHGIAKSRGARMRANRWNGVCECRVFNRFDRDHRGRTRFIAGERQLSTEEVGGRGMR